MPALRTAALLALVLLVACSSTEERSARARAEARAALERGDRLAALEALRGVSDEGEPPEALLDHAALLASAGETARAAWLLEQAVRRSPEQAGLRVALGQLALAVENPSAARDAVQPVPATAPEHPAALVVLAQAELKLGSLERALAVLEEAERRYPERLEARLVRVAVLATERRYAEARALLEETRRAGAAPGAPKEVAAALRRLDVMLHAAAAQRGREEAEAALAGLRALVAADRTDPEAWQATAQVLASLGRAKEAVALLDEAVAEDPGRVALYPPLAALRASLGEAGEAEATLRRLVERAPTASSWARLADLAVARRDAAGVLAVWTEAVAALPEDPLAARLHAEALVDAGRLEDARREIGRLERIAPKDPHAEFLRARVELAEGDARAARARLEQIVPEIDQAYTQFWLGRALEALGDRAGAERRYALALQRNPAEAATYAALIRLAQLRGDWREAAGVAELLVRRLPGAPEGWSALATSLVNLGAGEELEQVVRAWTAVAPGSAEAALFAARAARVRGQYAAALEALADVERRFDATPELAVERALVLGLSGRVPEGIAAARAALGESPDSAALHAGLASLLFAAGEGEAGARETDRALELAPDDPSPLRARAEFRAATGQLDAARADCERYLTARPDDAGVRFVLGSVHHAAGRPAEAAAAYRRAAELDEKAWAPRNNLAVLLGESDPPAALAAAQEAYAIAPANPDVLDTLGWLYVGADRVDRAISLLEDARRAAPGNAETALHLGLAYQRAGRADEARRILVAARDGAAGSPEVRARAEEALRSLP
jgi:tetratricopeptide (TPR) repeat protein